MDKRLERVRKKLKILMDTPNISWVLCDLIDLVDKDEQDTASREYGIPYGQSWRAYKKREKLNLIDVLKEKYISENRSTPPEQKN